MNCQFLLEVHSAKQQLFSAAVVTAVGPFAEPQTAPTCVCIFYTEHYKNQIHVFFYIRLPQLFSYGLHAPFLHIKKHLKSLPNLQLPYDS